MVMLHYSAALGCPLAPVDHSPLEKRSLLPNLTSATLTRRVLLSTAPFNSGGVKAKVKYPPMVTRCLFITMEGWRFDSTYDHKDGNGEPIPFVSVVGSGKVISGIESAVKSMKVGGLLRIVIPPSQGYQSTSQEPIPPNFFDRQRLFTTIFNPTRLANGEGSTLGTLVFDIKLVSLRHR